MTERCGVSALTSRSENSHRFWLCAFASIALLSSGASICARAQGSHEPVVPAAELPNEPGQVSSTTGPDQTSSAAPSKDDCVVTGTVMDTNGDVIQGARVVLTSRSGGLQREVQSGDNGQFAFSALPVGSYVVTVSGKDMNSLASPRFTISSGEVHIMSPMVLAVASATTSVTVTGDSEELKEQLSQQQVQIAVEQRVWGVFPNFYSSYDWHAPPMKPRQKFQLAFRSMIDPMAFAGAAGIAGAEQFYDIFPGYGSGAPGYFKRFGAAYTNDFSARMLSSGLFATLFHEDPRYFYKGTDSVRSRAMYAISCAFIARNDQGRWRPNYSHVLGVFTAAGLSNLYYPKENRGLSLTLINGAVETAGNAGTNIVREFILKGITTHAGGKH